MIAMLAAAVGIGALGANAAAAPLHVADADRIGKAEWQDNGARGWLEIQTVIFERGIPEKRLLRLDLHGARPDAGKHPLVHSTLLDLEQARSVRQAMARAIEHADRMDRTTDSAPVEVAGLRLEVRDQVLRLGMPGQTEAGDIPLSAARRVVTLLARGIEALDGGSANSAER